MIDHKTNNSVFFSNLDGLRFIAFLLVFLQHGFFNAFVHLQGHSNILDKLIKSLFVSGGTGVQIFFVLSGFLITYLILIEVKNTNSISILKFYIRRSLRIWPLYYATVIFAFIIYPFLKSLVGIDSELCSKAIYYFTFLANFDIININLNCPGKDAMSQAIVWSVSIEEQFYLIWPILFYLFPKRIHILIFFIIIVICAIFRRTANSPELYYHTFAVMGDLAIGGLFAYIAIYSKTFLKMITKTNRLIIIFLYLSIIFLYTFCSNIQIFNNIYSRFIFDLFWVYIILDQCFAKNSPFQLGKIKSFTNLGKISYGLYMLHPIGILFVDIATKLLKIELVDFTSNFIRGIISLALSIFFAKISYKYLERPFLKLKRKFTIVKTR